MKKYIPMMGVCFIIFTLVVTSMPVNAVETDYYQNSLIIIIGQCNTVNKPVMWGLGLYIPILRRSFYIATNNQEGEMISIIVKNEQNAFLISQENASIQMNGARGIYFWGKNSLILNNSSALLVIGRARDIWITH
jgi:hypothetical protein